MASRKRLAFSFCFMAAWCGSLAGQEPQEKLQVRPDSSQGSAHNAPAPQSPVEELAREYYDAAQRLDMLKVERTLQKLADQYPQDFLSQLAADHWRNHQRAQRPAAQGPMIITYRVADLVRRPDLLPSVSAATDRDADKKRLQGLMDLITKTISPGHWGPTELDARSILRHDGTLSLVVRANSREHKELADFLDQLRRLANIQIEVTMQVIKPPLDLTSDMGAFQVLDTDKLATLFQRLGQSSDVEIRTVPKVTLFNGEAAEAGNAQARKVVGGEEMTFDVIAFATTTADRRGVQLRVAASTDKLTSEEAVRLTRVCEVPDGGAVLLPLFDPRTSFDHEHLRKLGIQVANEPLAESYLLISTRIIVAEEEEELLGLAGHAVIEK